MGAHDLTESNRWPARASCGRYWGGATTPYRGPRLLPLLGAHLNRGKEMSSLLSGLIWGECVRHPNASYRGNSGLIVYLTEVSTCGQLRGHSAAARRTWPVLRCKPQPSSWSLVAGIPAPWAGLLARPQHFASVFHQGEGALLEYQELWRVYSFLPASSTFILRLRWRSGVYV